MKKAINIIIWAIALAALLAAAYTFYNKNKSQVTNPPLAQNKTVQGSTQGSAGETTSEGNAPNETAPEASTAKETVPEGTGAEASTAESTAVQEKIMAPDFTLKDLDGNEVKLSDYKGKIVILNFWAVWCKYCKQEMPDLNELDKELKEGNDAVILAVDVQESEDVVREYLTSNNISLKVLMDKNGSVAGSYGIEGYPTTFIINSDGSLYTYIPYATDLDTLHAILDKVRNGEPLQ